MKQRGDTIIEVLFALVVVGLTLATSISIANRSIQISRAAQEQTEALKLAESKIELVKIAYKNNIPSANVRNRGDTFCIVPDPIQSDGLRVTNINSGDCNSSAGAGYQAQIRGYAAGSGPRTYEVTITWDRIGTSSTDKGQLKMFYRPGVL